MIVLPDMLAPLAIEDPENVPTMDTPLEPLGVAHVPSPLQKVVELAEVPEFKFATGRFPVTSAVRLTALEDTTPPEDE